MAREFAPLSVPFPLPPEEDFKGFGLELAMVKRVIDAHGGRIRVDTAPWRGCILYFTFPLENKNPADSPTP